MREPSKIVIDSLMQNIKYIRKKAPISWPSYFSKNWDENLLGLSALRAPRWGHFVYYVLVCILPVAVYDGVALALYLLFDPHGTEASETLHPLSCIGPCFKRHVGHGSAIQPQREIFTRGGDEHWTIECAWQWIFGGVAKPIVAGPSCKNNLHETTNL